MLNSNFLTRFVLQLAKVARSLVDRQHPHPSSCHVVFVIFDRLLETVAHLA